MNNPLMASSRLAGSEGDGLGPYLNEQGAFLGLGTPLLEPEADAAERHRWRPRPRAELEGVLSVGYGLPVDLESRMGALRVVTDALSKGEMPRAAIALLHARLPALPDLDAARRMAEADPLAKYSPLQRYNPNWDQEPRIPKDNPGGGQWTTEGAGPVERPPTRVPEPSDRPNLIPAQEVIIEPQTVIRPIPFPDEIPFGPRPLPQGHPMAILAPLCASARKPLPG